MSAFQIFTLPAQQALDSSARVRAGAKLYFYLTGTSTPTDAYADSGLTTPIANPLTADSGGVFSQFFLDPNVTYRIVLKSAAGAVIGGPWDPANENVLSAERIGVHLYPRTDAEISAGVTPSDYSIPSHVQIGVLNIYRYGGAPGSGDNSDAMNRALAVCSALNGGIISLPDAGEWRMNITIAAHNIKIVMPKGKPEFDVNCIRPYNIAAGPAITWGDGTTDYRYCGVENCSFSGTNDPGGAHFSESSHSASHCILIKGGMIGFTSINSWFYNGIRTVSLEPSTTNPVTGARFIGGGARNDLWDSASARTLYGKRIDSDNGYYTDNLFIGFKVNGPGNSNAANTRGYAGEFDGTGYPMVVEFIDCYIDCKKDFGNPATVCHGLLLKGSVGVKGRLTLDPGNVNIPVIETDQSISDVGRIIVGELRHGGQKVSMSGTIVDLPAEADTFSYKHRIHTPFIIGQRFIAPAGGTNQYATTASWSMVSTTGPESLDGVGLEVRKNITVWGGNAAACGVIDSNTVNGGLFLAAQGTNQDVRVVPSGTGVVRLEGAKTRPNLDNSQDLGAVGNRWAVIYAGTGTINTSDEREKADIEEIPQAWLDAWSEVQWQRYRWKDAIEKKGDRARWHVGLIAQRVIDAFARHGLDACELGIVCYDEWEDEYEDVRVQTPILDDKGDPITDGNGTPLTTTQFTGEKRLVRKAGNRYGIRYEEALALECAMLRSRLLPRFAS